MKRPRTKKSLPRLSRESERLVALAQGLSASGSLLEDRFWETKLHAELDRLLDHGADVAIESALDMLYATQPPAYEALIDLAESAAESFDLDGMDVLLFAAPILAWSKYAIASGPIKPDARDALLAQLHGHVLARDARAELAPYLYSIDQLPRGFAATRALGRQLARRAIGVSSGRPAGAAMPETAPLLADTRYLVAAVVVAKGAPVFRWQEAAEGGRDALRREQVLDRWRSQGMPNLSPLLPGCVFDVLIPDGYHYACRESDRAIRPYGIRAAVAFLETALSIPASQLQAIVAPFGEERVEEYRIGFAASQGSEIVHGVVWPLYGRETPGDADEPTEEIGKLLAEAGVGRMTELDSLFPLEYCDDCGAPLFADAAGDLVHAELPEETEPPRAHLH